MKIEKKIWFFAEKIDLPEYEKEYRFLFWKWKKVIRPKIWKYKNISQIMEEVNQFIIDQKITSVVSLKDTCETVHYDDWGTEWSDRIGDIELIYTID